MSAAARRPRLVDTPAAEPVRTSDAIRSDVAALAQEKADTDGELSRLTLARRMALVAGEDETVEQHDVLIARAKRRLERVELREPELADALAAAEAQEQVAAREEQCRQAEGARDNAVAALKRYDAAAKEIAAVMAIWTEATALCLAAGVRTPNFVARGLPDRDIPERRETVTAYLREDGEITQDMHRRRADGIIEPGRYRQAVQREVVAQEARTDVGARLPELSTLVSLPYALGPGYYVEATSKLRNSY